MFGSRICPADASNLVLQRAIQLHLYFALQRCLQSVDVGPLVVAQYLLILLRIGRQLFQQLLLLNLLLDAYGSQLAGVDFWQLQNLMRVGAVRD